MRRLNHMDKPLERGSSAVARRPRRRLLRSATIVATLAVIIIGGLVAKRTWFSSRELDCITASSSPTLPDGDIFGICQREYERTKLPLTGTYFADALRRANNAEAASALANALLSTEARANALQILGRIALDQHRTEDAVRSLKEARQLHREQGQHVQVAKDNVVLAKIQIGQDQYAEALQTLEECISEARADPEAPGDADRRWEGFCRITASRALIAVGYFDAADQELDRAAQLLSGDRDLADVWYGRANLAQEVMRSPLHRTHNAMATTAFERSLELAVRLQRTSLVLNNHLNLAFSFAELGNTEEADRHLAEAGLLDRDGKHKSERAQLAARIAYRRGNLDLAYSLNAQLYPRLDDDDDEDANSDVCVMQARIALARGDLADASLWARRGVASAEKVRSAQTLGELRPWVLATRREPFEVLFTALARAGLVEDAIIVFDQWQGRTLLDEMARPSPELALGLSNTATRIQSLGRWLPAVSAAPLMTSDVRAVIQTLGAIDLLALTVAEGDIWRLTASHGRLKLDNLGSARKLGELLDRFGTVPTDHAAAGALGALVLPDELVRTTNEPLYVVLDAPLAAMPFVALRRNDQPVVVARPVLRAPRLPVASACVARTGITSAVVLADAAGDLPDARRESSRVASMFRTTPLVGAAATSTALFAAKSDPLLHIAVHAEIDAGGGVLKLHDRAVSAPEISASKLGPSLVVLSGCGTANAWDPELAGSLSTAFLAGGSERVVATLRSVSDAGTLEVTSRFYDAGGAEDPVRVLAKIQAGLAQSDNKEWPSFAVFGSTACVPGPGR